MYEKILWGFVCHHKTEPERFFSSSGTNLLLMQRTCKIQINEFLKINLKPSAGLALKNGAAGWGMWGQGVIKD